MEQRAYQKWTRGLLLGLVLVLMACAAVVYRVDPCFYSVSYTHLRAHET